MQRLQRLGIIPHFPPSCFSARGPRLSILRVYWSDSEWAILIPVLYKCDPVTSPFPFLLPDTRHITSIVHIRGRRCGERRGLTCNVHWTPVPFFLSAQTWTANTWWNLNLGDTEPTLKSQINTFARHVYVSQTLIIFTSWCQQNKLKPQCLWRLKKLQKKPPLKLLIDIIAGNVIKCWHFGGNLCILSVAIVLHKVARQS